MHGGERKLTVTGHLANHLSSSQPTVMNLEVSHEPMETLEETRETVIPAEEMVVFIDYSSFKAWFEGSKLPVMGIYHAASNT